MSDYKITDKDVEGMLSFLKHHHPDQATKDHAYAYLEWLKEKVHEISVQDPTSEDLYQLFLTSLGE